MYIYTVQDALFICYKQSPDNARSVASSQRANSPRLIEDETLNDSGIISNLIDDVDGQEEPDSLRANEILGGNASQAAKIVNGVYGANTVTANYVQFWFRRFRSDIFYA
ncbi:uncharacterized protein TNCV_1766721 [Trichonephila clavipes]|nr:uncharacterized protein TNCV_1766721 [Trichonephila clavipes]